MYSDQSPAFQWDAVQANKFSKPKPKGSPKAKAIADAIRTRQTQAASDSIKKVKENRRQLFLQVEQSEDAPVRAQILAESSTAHLKDLLKSKGRFLSPDHRKAIDMEVKMRETGVPF